MGSPLDSVDDPAFNGTAAQSCTASSQCTHPPSGQSSPGYCLGNGRAHGLLDPRRGIEAVDLVEIDAIEAQPPQAGIDAGQDVRARQPDLVDPRADAPRTLVVTSTCSRRRASAFNDAPTSRSLSPSEPYRSVPPGCCGVEHL
jgi:hypothetical protein